MFLLSMLCHSTHVEAGEQLAGIDSLPLFCGSRVVSGRQVWGQINDSTRGAGFRCSEVALP